MITITAPNEGATFSPGEEFQIDGTNGPPTRCFIKPAAAAKYEVDITAPPGEEFSFLLNAPNNVGLFVVFLEEEGGKGTSRTFEVATSA